MAHQFRACRVNCAGWGLIERSVFRDERKQSRVVMHGPCRRVTLVDTQVTAPTPYQRGVGAHLTNEDDPAPSAGLETPTRGPAACLGARANHQGTSRKESTARAHRIHPSAAAPAGRAGFSTPNPPESLERHRKCAGPWGRPPTRQRRAARRRRGAPGTRAWLRGRPSPRGARGRSQFVVSLKSPAAGAAAGATSPWAEHAPQARGRRGERGRPLASPA